MSVLKSLLERVTRDVPRYAGLPIDLSAFPVVTKTDMLANLDAHLSRSVEDRAALLAFLRAEERCDGKYESQFDSRIVVEETSGSSGIPFRVPKTAEERFACATCLWRYRRRYDPRVRPHQVYPFIHEPRGFPTLCDPYELDAPEVDQLYRGLSERGYTWLHGEPRLLRWHAERISDEVARDMTPRFAESTGQAMSAEDREVIERGLGLTLIDQYGCREAFAIGIRDDDGAFEILHDSAVVELVGDDGSVVDAPHVTGRIVVTALHQRLFPFVRYDTGDRGSWDDDGVGARFHVVPTREHNVLRLGEADADGSAFFKNMLFLSFERMGRVNLRYVQVRQLGPKHFVLATSATPKAPLLRDTLAQLMAGGIHRDFPRDARFDLVELSEDEVQCELRGKQALFTTRYMHPDDASHATAPTSDP